MILSGHRDVERAGAVAMDVVIEQDQVLPGPLTQKELRASGPSVQRPYELHDVVIVVGRE